VDGAGGRRGYSRYSKRRSFGKKNYTTKSSAVSMQHLRKQVEVLSMNAQHGQARKFAFTGDGRVPLKPQTGSDYYFAVPLSEIVQGICRAAGTASVFVAGFCLEGDIYYSVPVDWFAACAAVPSADLPVIEIHGEKGLFPVCRLRMDEKGSSQLWDFHNPYVQAVFRSAYTDVARDRTLFNAPMRSGQGLSGTVSTGGSKKSVRHTGRASGAFTRVSPPGMDVVVNKFTKAPFRSYWTAGSKWTVLDGSGHPFGEQHTILCGIRPQSDDDLPGTGKGEGPPIVAFVKDIRVTVHVRY